MFSFTSPFKRAFLLSLSTSIMVCAVFLSASELLIRSRVAVVEPFSQSVELFWRIRREGVRNAAFGASIIARALIIDDPQFANLAADGENLSLTRAKVLAFIKDRSVGQIILTATGKTLNRQIPAHDVRTDFFSGEREPWLMLQMEHHRHFILAYWRTYLLKGNFDRKSRFLRLGGVVPTPKDDKIPLAELSPDQRLALGRKSYLDVAAFRYRRPEDSPGLRIYREIIQRILENGGEVCLLHGPYSPQFRKFSDANEWYSVQMPRIWQQFAASFGPKVRFVNAIDLVDDINAFRDAIHMTEEGGRRIGPRLVNRCFPKYDGVIASKKAMP